MNKETLTVDMFRPDDAEGVGRLFTEVYGDGYPAKIVYNPGQLVSAFKNQDNIPIVVRTPENRIVGYSSLFRAAPDKGVYEKGNGAVSPDFRNAGIMSMIFQYVKEVIPKIDDLNIFFGEPVCNHIYIQKAAATNLPMVDTAIEIDLMPAEAYEKEKSASGRVSTLLMFMTITPRPHTVHVPPMYADYFEYIYGGLDDKRTLSPSTDDLPSLPQTHLDRQIFDFAQVARVAVLEAGADFENAFSEEEKLILSKNVQVIQVWLKLSWPWIGAIVTMLKEKGYFFGGILPQWFGDDGLLMQKILLQPNWDGINLYSERAQKILEFIKSDWQK
ncbi:MAG: hypothetical protein C0399_05290 [Syntrophus sp. (in: bacteria)]|nr:hypothetical protein [Syntrophus sp. (in: bacteria)]